MLKLLLENHMLVQKCHESLKQKQRLKFHLTDSVTQQGASYKNCDDFKWHCLVMEYNNRAAISPQVFCKVYNPRWLCNFFPFQLPLCHCVLFSFYYFVVFNLLTEVLVQSHEAYFSKICFIAVSLIDV